MLSVHRKLNAAVFAAYGWPQELRDEEILARLLALNLERRVRRPAWSPVPNAVQAGTRSGEGRIVASGV
jgi:hypothetical protein